MPVHHCFLFCPFQCFNVKTQKTNCYHCRSGLKPGESWQNCIQIRIQAKLSHIIKVEFFYLHLCFKFLFFYFKRAFCIIKEQSYFFQASEQNQFGSLQVWSLCWFRDTNWCLFSIKWKFAAKLRDKLLSVSVHCTIVYSTVVHYLCHLQRI